MSSAQLITTDSFQTMQDVLDLQKAAYLREGAVSYKTRINRIDRLLQQIIKYKEPLVETICQDFGHRSRHHSLVADIVNSLLPLKEAKKNLKKWMRTESRKIPFPLRLMGGSARVEYQPLGVVGVISPWNFPVYLTVAPLAGILAAGNRAMIKPSEYTPATSQLFKKMIEEEFDTAEIAVFTGGSEEGAIFSSLAFDHLIFTGATSIARHIMTATATNLVPVTLELGGKSPVIISRSADLSLACKRIISGKTINAGQICIAPDYVLVPEELVDKVVDLISTEAEKMFPSLLHNADYTSIINRRHYERLRHYLVDAQEKGAKILEINPAGESFKDQPFHKIPPTLVFGMLDDMLISREEIFGPILPIIPYQNIQHAVHYINLRARPLALYYFGEDRTEEKWVLSHTTSGGVTVNDVMMHVAMENLPFGGVGASGMGSYHGYDGFKNFSHAKSIYRNTKIDLMRLLGMIPPFSKKTDSVIKLQLK